ncbi:MAG: hypothetical protein IKM72_11940 [Oscillospiraceae bacterium]|nr:hypothetical protein [Oscillospiraceae bacterium]
MIYGEDINLSDRVRITEDNKELTLGFDCGNETMNKYLKEKSYEDTKATTFIIKNNDDNTVICYYSLCCSGLVINTNDGNLFSMYPAVEIKMFAVDEKYQHIPYYNEPDTCSLSDMLFYDVIGHINEFTENECAADKIILYAVPKAESFYSRNMFKKFEEYMKPASSWFTDECIPMFMSL